MNEITNEVIAERLDNLIRQSQFEHDKMSKNIEKINGSVASLKMWRAYMTGAIAVLASLIVPIFLIIVSKFLN